jgi:hypothetical protein
MSEIREVKQDQGLVSRRELMALIYNESMSKFRHSMANRSYVSRGFRRLEAIAFSQICRGQITKSREFLNSVASLSSSWLK